MQLSVQLHDENSNPKVRKLPKTHINKKYLIQHYHNLICTIQMH